MPVVVVSEPDHVPAEVNQPISGCCVSVALRPDVMRAVYEHGNWSGVKVVDEVGFDRASVTST